MTRISGEIIQELLPILRPLMQDKQQRQAYLILALGTHSKVFNRLVWDTATDVFIPQMINALVTFGEIPSGKPALCALLEVVNKDVGLDKQLEIDDLLQRIREELKQPSLYLSPGFEISMFEEPGNIKPPLYLLDSCIHIIGDRASGITSFIVTLVYYPNLYPHSPIQAVTSYNQETSELINQAKDILMQGLMLEPTRIYQEPYEMPYYHLCIELKLSLTAYPITSTPSFKDSIAAWIRRSIIINIALREYPGELIQELSQSNDYHVFWAPYFEDLALIKTLLFFIDCNSTRDTKYAKAFEKLRFELELRKNVDDLSKCRIAVVFSKFEQQENWIHLKSLERFMSLKFPRTRATFQKWSQAWGCSIAYFACSTFGIMGAPPQPNVKVQCRGEWGISGVLANPKLWKPFGIFAPIYWLYTGKDDSRLRKM